MKGIFSYGDSLKIDCSYHLCLQMSLNSELELLSQLQKWRQRCYVACGKRLTTGGTSAALPMEVTLSHNYPEVKLGVFCYILTVQKRCVCPLYKFLYAFKVVKLFLKHPVLILLPYKWVPLRTSGMMGNFVCSDFLNDATVYCQVESAWEEQPKRSSIAWRQANVSELDVSVNIQSNIRFVPHWQTIPLYIFLYRSVVLSCHRTSFSGQNTTVTLCLSSRVSHSSPSTKTDCPNAFK